MATIYALTQPGTGEVRYVGKTSRKDLLKRVQEHWAECRSEQHRRACWLRSLAAQGLAPGVVALEHVSERQANGAEIRWIAHFREQGADLVNGTDGGDGGALNAEARLKISEKAKGRPGPMRGRKHTPETRAKMREAALKRVARGDSPVCDPEQQRKAARLSRSKDSPEAREANARHLASIASAGAKARWG